MADNNHIDAALRYVHQGWPIFPLQGKQPLKGSAGFKDATTSTAAVYDWWTHNPAYNIGLGIPDWMIVIDVDPRNGGLAAIEKLQQDYGWLPQTRCAVSGRGDGGLHYYYLRPDIPLVGNLNRAGYAGIDIKKQPGYVVLPPSTHPDTGRPYRWVDEDCPVAPPPDWLAVVAARPAEPSPTAATGPVTASNVLEALDVPDVDRWNGDGLVTAVAGSKPGERNNVLNWACWSLRDDYQSAKVSDLAFQKCLALIIDAAEHAGLPEKEIMSTINSAFRTGTPQ
jgi:hypothetical protein